MKKLIKRNFSKIVPNKNFDTNLSIEKAYTPSSEIYTNPSKININ
jgi:hypothetical protein